MSTPRLSILTALAALLGACGPQPEAGLYLSSNVSTFDGRTEHAVVRVQAFQASGEPGQGVVTLLTPAGHFAGGNEVTLVEGFGTASFLCDPGEDSACSGAVRLSATWAAQSAAALVRVTPAVVATQVHWKAVPTGTLATLHAMAVADAHVLWAVGTAGAVLKLTDGAWQGVASGTLETLLAVAVTPGGAPVAVGENGTLLRWGGTAFQAIPGDVKETYTSVAALSDTDLVVGTASGHLLRWDGQALTPEADLGSPVLSLVAQGTAVWAGGVGAMAVRDEAGWTVKSAPVLARLSVASSSPEGVYLGGSRLDTSGGVLILGPTDWRTQALTSPLTAMAVVPRSTERFAVSEGAVLRAEGMGTTWLSANAPMGGNAAASRTVGDLVVVGAPGVSIMRVP